MGPIAEHFQRTDRVFIAASTLLFACGITGMTGEIGKVVTLDTTINDADQHWDLAARAKPCPVASATLWGDTHAFRIIILDSDSHDFRRRPQWLSGEPATLRPATSRICV